MPFPRLATKTRCQQARPGNRASSSHRPPAPRNQAANDIPSIHITSLELIPFDIWTLAITCGD